MKTSLDHLPPGKRREIDRVLEILHEEFEDAVKPATPEGKRRGRIYKVILFGSYARGGWVDEKNIGKGYQSDYDILIVVNHKDLTDEPRYWWAAEDRISRDKSIKTPVEFIVHTLEEVNDRLGKGDYFFKDIREQGIALYEFEGTKASGNRRHDLAKPGNLTPREGYEAAKRYFDKFFPRAVRRTRVFKLELEESKDDPEWRCDAAFTLHQATEQAYKAVLLTLTLYTPPGHNINKLRGLVESLDRRLVEAWPRGRKPYDGYFQLLRRAYVDARYSENFEITRETLDWLAERVEHLHQLVETVCTERLAKLKAEAGET